MGSAVWAQQPETPQEKPKPAFPQIFPQPTGTNGFEEFVLAGDLARQHPLLDIATQANATLGDKRRALFAPEIRKAMELIRIGVGKNVEPPQRVLDENTLFPEFAGFRALARLLSVHIYVSLADGQINTAIDDLNATLRLGYYVQSDSIISGLVGITVDTIGMNSLAKHLPQFAVRDCDRLILVVGNWLKVPPPEIRIIVSEIESAVNILKKNKDNEKFSELFRIITGVSDEPNVPSKLQKALENPGIDTHSIVNGAINKIVKLSSDSIANFKLPYWKRTRISIVDDGSLAYQVADAITPTLSSVSDRYMQVLAQMQLLVVHAAIRKFQWENGRLPNALEELRREREEGLLTDPFTGELLVYKLDGERYELYSTGIPERDQNGKIMPNSGKAIYMPTPKRPAVPVAP